MQNYLLSTIYEADTDIIRAYIESENAIEVEIEFHCATNQIVVDLMHNDISNFAVVNTFEIAGRVTQMLLDATNEDTEIPMCIDDALTITL